MLINFVDATNDANHYTKPPPTYEGPVYQNVAGSVVKHTSQAGHIWHLVTKNIRLRLHCFVKFLCIGCELRWVCHNALFLLCGMECRQSSDENSLSLHPSITCPGGGLTHFTCKKIFSTPWGTGAPTAALAMPMMSYMVCHKYDSRHW